MPRFRTASACWTTPNTYTLEIVDWEAGDVDAAIGSYTIYEPAPAAS